MVTRHIVVASDPIFTSTASYVVADIMEGVVGNWNGGGQHPSDWTAKEAFDIYEEGSDWTQQVADEGIEAQILADLAVELENYEG